IVLQAGGSDAVTIRGQARRPEVSKRRSSSVLSKYGSNGSVVSKQAKVGTEQLQVGIRQKRSREQAKVSNEQSQVGISQKCS
ncbi:unnamed protein product, partial [Staurois parvus]